MQIIDNFVNETEISIEEINQAFRDNLHAQTFLAQTMAKIETGYDEAWSEIVADAKEAGLDVVDGVCVGVDKNAYKFAASMKRMANSGIDAYKVAMDINSPSRVMEHETEFVVDGAVISIDRNLADFEAAMKRLAYAGRDSYVQAQLSRADDYPIMYSPAVQPIGGGANYARHYGGFNIQIHQQPGQSPDDLVDVLMDRIQTLVDSKEAGL
jgi:hypothetical protein